MRLNVSSLALSATLGCALGAPAYAAPFLALGESAEVFLTAGVGARYTSNIFLSANDVDDTVFSLTPGIEILFGKGSLSTGRFFVSEEFTRYVDLSELNEELFSTGLTFRYDDLKLRVSVDASFRQVNEASRDVISTLEILDLIERDVSRLNASGELRMTAKTKAGIGARYDRTNFKLPDFTDSSYLAFPANLYYEYSEKVDLSAGITYRDVSLSRNANESTDIYYNLGARGEFTPKLKGNFSLGFRTRDFERARTSGGSDSDSMFGFDAGFTYEVTPKLSSDITLSQDFGTGPTGESTDDMSLSWGADAMFTPEWSAGATLTYRDTVYSGNRQDDFYVFQLRGSHIYNEYIRLTAYYVFSNNDSTFRRLTFTNHTLGFIANLRY